ncbi:MAG: hypothetical protein DRN71_00035 [Candidatus Nanohalarchaeota archaeon]|nr:MAG: hypothetical protein DRN71_00035 [Candidatus Nanohaloarchaeota archaeon]
MRFYDTEQMQKKALYVSDILLNTPGIPPDWNTSNVQMAGFRNVDSSTLDSDKLINFRLLEYNRSKEVLGLRSYDYCINITDPEGMLLKLDGVVTGTAAVFATGTDDNIIKDFLENYQNDWDYYWARPGAVPSNNATHVYQDPNQNDLFDVLIDNISSYNTIIIEGINALTVTAADEVKIQNFVSVGGTFIDIQDDHFAQLIKHFANVPDGESADNSDEIGTAIKKDILLPEKDVGETVTFETAKFRFNMSEVDKAIVESDGHAGYCIVCLWYYGSGKIYYLPDGSKDNTKAPVDGMDFDGIELIYGNDETLQADDVVPIRRLITIAGGQVPKIGLMNLYIYK